MKKNPLPKRQAPGKRLRVLITGGAGFIGAHTAALLEAEGHSVRVLDVLDPQVHGARASFPAALSKSVEKRRGDVNDRAALTKALEGVDAVAHFAAQTGVGQSMYGIHSYSGVNVTGTASLAEAILRRGPPYPRLLLASSRAVYGEGSARCPAHGVVFPGLRERSRLEAGDLSLRCPACGAAAEPVPTAETHPLTPVSFYGWTKAAQEEICRHVERFFGLSVTVLRYFNVYGFGQSLLNPYTGLVSIFYNRLRAGKPLSLYEAGRPLRDFVHVSDVARANVAVLAGPGSRSGVFNIGSGVSTTIRGVAEALGEILNTKPKLEDRGEYRAGDILSGVADVSAARAALGYEPRVSLKEGLAEFVRWAERQPAVDRYEKTVAELRQRGLFGSGIKWK